MKKSKKVILCILCCALVSFTISVPAEAAKTYSKSFTKSSGFSKSFSKHKNLDINVSGTLFGIYLDYGYTKLTNKDYVDSVGGVPSGCKCKGKVKNSNGTSKSTNSVGTGVRSGKASVKHTGKVTYTGSMWFK